MAEPGRAPASAGQPEDPASFRYAWYVVSVLTLIYVFSFLDRTILNLLVEPIKADLGISDTQMSYLMGAAFAIFYTLFGLPVGRLADSRNRTLLIAGGLLVWNFMTAGCGVARKYWQLLTFRIGVGVGEATLSPSAYSIITDYFPPQRLATALSVYSTGIYIGAGISTVLGGLVAGFAQRQGDLTLPLIGATRPWQVVFLVVGLAGMVPLVLLLATVREPLRKVARASPATEKAVASQLPLKEVLAYLLENRSTILCHHLGYAVLSFSSYGVGYWTPTFMIRTHQWPVEKVGIFLGIHAAVTGTLGALAGGAFSDWLGRRGIRDAKLRVGLMAAIAWAPTGILYPLVGNGTLAFVLMIPTYFFTTFPTGAAAAAVQELMPAPMRGQASAVYLFVVNVIGLGIGPTAVALTTDYVFGDEAMLRYSLVTVGIAAHVAACLLFFVGLKPYRRSLDRVKEWEAEPRPSPPADGGGHADP